MSDDTGSNIVQPTLGNTLTPISGSTTARMLITGGFQTHCSRATSGDNIVFLHSDTKANGPDQKSRAHFERQCARRCA